MKRIATAEGKRVTHWRVVLAAPRRPGSSWPIGPPGSRTTRQFRHVHVGVEVLPAVTHAALESHVGVGDPVHRRRIRARSRDAGTSVKRLAAPGIPSRRVARRPRRADAHAAAFEFGHAQVVALQDVDDLQSGAALGVRACAARRRWPWRRRRRRSRRSGPTPGTSPASPRYGSTCAKSSGAVP